MLMNAGATTLNARDTVDQTLIAMQEMDRYCSAHPNSPAATRHPRLSIRGRTFVALLGRNIEQGIAGFGDTVQAALRAFDLQYCALLRRLLIAIRIDKPHKNSRRGAFVESDGICVKFLA